MIYLCALGRIFGEMVMEIGTTQHPVKKRSYFRSFQRDFVP